MKNTTTNPDYYIGIDYHKSFSQVHVLDRENRSVWKGKIKHEEMELFDDLITKHTKGKCWATLESTMNWHILYDYLKAIDLVDEVLLANPLKIRLICEAQIKNDKVDALKLAQLLRLDMLPRVHASSLEARELKEIVRQRHQWFCQRVQIRNRTHRLLGSVPNLEIPKYSDLFGTRGLNFSEKCDLPYPKNIQLKQNIDQLKGLNEVIRNLEKELTLQSKTSETLCRIQTIPGIGKVLGAIIDAEIDDVKRFETKAKFVAYCGLAPKTSSSAGKTYQGRMMTHCNKWLKTAFIEASWVAIGCDHYFGNLRTKHQLRGKKANTTITVVARRMAQICWELLNQQRDYQPKLSTACS